MGIYISNNKKRLIKVSSLREPLEKTPVDYAKLIPLIDNSSASINVSNLKLTQLSEAQLLALENNNNLESNQIYITYDDNLEPTFPIGALYLTTASVSPASMFGGTWERLPANYALWTATSGAGNTISAGLPNITGSQRFGWTDASGGGSIFGYGGNGSFYVSNSGTSYYSTAGASGNHYQNTLNIDASRSSSIYGSSTTVQPPAYKVYAWRRTA